MRTIQKSAQLVAFSLIGLALIGCGKDAKTPDADPPVTNSPAADPPKTDPPVANQPKTDPPGANPPKSDAPAGPQGKAFLDKKYKVPPRLEWNTNIGSKKGGPISFRVTSQGPFSVTVINDAGYQALQRKNLKRMNKTDLLLTADSDTDTYEGQVTVPPGQVWFIIANRATKEVEFRLECFTR